MNPQLIPQLQASAKKPWKPNTPVKGMGLQAF